MEKAAATPSRTLLAQGVNIAKGPLFAQKILNAFLVITGYSPGPESSATNPAQSSKDPHICSHFKRNYFGKQKDFLACLAFLVSKLSMLVLSSVGCSCLLTEHHSWEERSCQSRKFCSPLVNQRPHSAGSYSGINIEVKSGLDTTSFSVHEAKPFFYNY